MKRATHQLLVPVAVERILHRRSVSTPGPDAPGTTAWVARLQAHPHKPRAVASGWNLNSLGRAAPVVVGAGGGSALGVYVHAANVAPFGTRGWGGRGGAERTNLAGKRFTYLSIAPSARLLCCILFHRMDPTDTVEVLLVAVDPTAPRR